MSCLAHIPRAVSPKLLCPWPARLLSPLGKLSIAVPAVRPAVEGCRLWLAPLSRLYTSLAQPLRVKSAIFMRWLAA